MRYSIAYIFIFFSIFCFGQSTVTGTVYGFGKTPLQNAYVQMQGKVNGVLTNKRGKFTISVPSNSKVRLVTSYAGALEVKMVKTGEPGSFHDIVVVLKAKQFKEAVVVGEKIRDQVSVDKLDPRKVVRFPTAGSFETTLTSIVLGARSGNELSSSYSVRGGNFDENLVYINDIAIYRPFLVRSGQQEGLSIINADMVQSIEFSAGGFQAKYGDKLSSVLDIRYAEPDSFRSTISASLLGGSVHFEGREGKGRFADRFTYVVGARYRTNQYLLGSLDVQGDYRPRFFDVQTLLKYQFTHKMSLSYLAAVSQNRYLVSPESRQTSFGNVNSALSLSVAFGGSELMEYTTLVNGLNLEYFPDKKTKLNLIVSSYNALEREHFTVEGAYRLSELDNNLGSDDFANERRLLGLGYFIDHARNDLQAQVYTAEHKGSRRIKLGNIAWGASVSTEIIDDKIKEWRFNDSSGYNIGTTSNTSTTNDIILDEFLEADIAISSFRVSGFAQHNVTLSRAHGVRLNYGLRSNYWTFNEENVVSPRAQLSFQPNKKYNDSLDIDAKDSLAKRDWVVKSAFGYYYQPPFYRELRNIEGVINPNLKAQKSIHFVLGTDLNFKAWNRPFKFVSEVYYKHLDNLVPYVIDNVRIRYLAENSSQGYATGLDARVNGEFIEGVESWFNFSLLQTKERIYYNDENGVEQLSDWLRRPTDQRVNFSILFQDELPSNERIKMNLNLVYGSSVPFYFDATKRYTGGFKIPAYRRVDIGFSAVLVDETNKKRPKWLNGAESLWGSIEIFNLLQVNNTISYVLVKDFANNVYGVPNYLTGRRINVRLILKI